MDGRKSLNDPPTSWDRISTHTFGLLSFIYDLHRNSNLPWVYGGEYEEFHHLVSTVVRAWIKVGFQVYFVFDGLYNATI